MKADLWDAVTESGISCVRIVDRTAMKIEILCKDRWSLTPQLFEAIMFLKFNERFWDAQLVRDAVMELVRARVEARIKVHELEEESLSSLEE